MIADFCTSSRNQTFNTTYNKNCNDLILNYLIKMSPTNMYYYMKKHQKSNQKSAAADRTSAQTTPSYLGASQQRTMEKRPDEKIVHIKEPHTTETTLESVEAGTEASSASGGLLTPCLFFGFFVLLVVLVARLSKRKGKMSVRRDIELNDLSRGRKVFDAADEMEAGEMEAGEMELESLVDGQDGEIAPGTNH